MTPALFVWPPRYYPSRPPCPSSTISRTTTRSPASRRGSSRSTMLVSRERTQPGAPSTGKLQPDALRRHVVAIHDRGFAGGDQQLGARLAQLDDRAGDG